MTDYQKSFSILNPIIFGESWEEETKPFTLDGLHKALDEGGAIKRVSVGVTIRDYLHSLVDTKMVKHLGKGVYQKDSVFCVNHFCN